MALTVESEASILHNPVLHKGRVIKSNGYSICSRAYPDTGNALATVLKTQAGALESTRAQERLPDVVLGADLLAELTEEMGGKFVAIWLTQDPQKPVVIRCKNDDAFAILMPMHVRTIKPLDLGADK